MKSHLNGIFTLFFCATFTSIECLIYRSLYKPVNCSESDGRINYDSFLLTEGESLTLSCDVCEVCAHLKECQPNFSHESWFIQRARSMGSSEDLPGGIYETPFDIHFLRLRLRERLWPGMKGAPSEVELMTPYHPPKANATQNATESSSDVDATLTESPTIDTPPLMLYFLVAKPGETSYAIKTDKAKSTKSRIVVSFDEVEIRQTRVEDTGVYTCVVGGYKRKIWTVTVKKPGEEPFRQILPQPSQSPRAKALNSEELPEVNLLLYTKWYPWSECAPCTNDSDTKTSSFQLRVGICYVALMDSFYPPKPHRLALDVDSDLRLSETGDGLPCRSHLIGDAMKRWGPIELAERPSELIVRRCVKICRNDTNNTEFQFEPNRFKLPKRVLLSLSEGEFITIRCPIRGSVRGPITWYYLPSASNLISFTKEAVSVSNLLKYGSPSRYLAANLPSVDLIQLATLTRGQYRVDPGYNLVVTDIYNIEDDEKRSPHRLACVHGDANVHPDLGFSDWAGIVEVDVTPRSQTVITLSKIAQVLLLLIPLILALATFAIIVLSMWAERSTKMRASVRGSSSKANLKK